MLIVSLLWKPASLNALQTLKRLRYVEAFLIAVVVGIVTLQPSFVDWEIEWKYTVIACCGTRLL
jgi:hypothetical protein